MKITQNQSATKTLADLLRALDHQHAVTITYVKDDGAESLRTLEIIDIRTTKNGSIIVRAMDRESGEARSFSLSGVRSYTLHRSAYQVERPTDDTGTEAPAPAAAVRSVAALIAFEINRDIIAAAYRTRTTLAA